MGFNLKECEWSLHAVRIFIIYWSCNYNATANDISVRATVFCILSAWNYPSTLPCGQRRFLIYSHGRFFSVRARTHNELSIRNFRANSKYHWFYLTIKEPWLKSIRSCYLHGSSVQTTHEASLLHTEVIFRWISNGLFDKNKTRSGVLNPDPKTMCF